ncbi:MAG: NapC/NirT family cytochrome c [Bryobacterales bacterium]|nr:NapC/NirT family cytochrome c [Bryobacterales bacterium]
MKRFQEWFAPFVFLSSNWISLVGVVMVTTAGLLWVFLLPTMLRGAASDPYLGILMFMVLPMVFFAGLGLIPLGIWRYRRGHGDSLPEVFPPIDLNNLRFRKLLKFLAVTTVLNLVIGSQLVYRAVHYMETVSFCGQTCHTVMEPEFTAYSHSPHANVACVSCHIGPGANWFVQSKISGAWQVVSVTFDLFPRPIPTPIENLRPARETCESCHWPQKYGGDRVRVVDKFADDETSTHTKTVLLMHIGGGNGYRGIHGAHMGPGIEMRYAHSDHTRQQIPWVEFVKNGKRITYNAKDYEGDGPGDMPLRVMDCIDCHNRPSHTFEVPERAIDRVLSDGSLDLSLPFARKTGLEILKASYETGEAARREIPARFAAFYRDNYPEIWQSRREAVDAGGNAVLKVFSENVFPEMKVTWGAYPNNLGHTDFPGCFRCHDNRAGSEEGTRIARNCSSCHKMLAFKKEAPEILDTLGLAPK